MGIAAGLARSWVRLSGPVAMVILVAPVAAGLGWVVLPAFGHLPALGFVGPSWQAWQLLLAEPGLLEMIALSLAAGVITPLVSFLALMLFLAGSFEGRTFRWMRRALSPILAVPHAAAAFGLAFLIAPSGLIARALSPWATGWQRPPDLLILQDPMGLAMMAGLITKEIPFLMLMALAALAQIDAPRRMAMGRTLGYAPMAAWLKTVEPALYPLLRLPIFAVIAYASSTVEIALILGPTTPPTLAVALLGWINDPDLDMRLKASAAALLQLGVTVLALALWWVGERLVAWLFRPALQSGGRRLAERPLRWVGVSAMILASLAAFGGLAALAIWSVSGLWRFPDTLPATLTLTAWNRAADQMLFPLANALGVAGAATGLAVVLVLGALEHEHRRGRQASRAAQAVLYIPLLVPAIAFLFGLVLAQQVAGLTPGPIAVTLGHVVFVLPYVYLSLAEAYRRLDPRWSLLAASLGHGPDRALFTVRVPLLSRALATAAAVGFAVSIGQYLATQLLGAGRVPTVTTEAIALASGGDRRLIAVWALLQALLPALAFALALALPRLLWHDRRGMRGL